MERIKELKRIYLNETIWRDRLGSIVVPFRWKYARHRYRDVVLFAIILFFVLYMTGNINTGVNEELFLKKVYSPALLFGERSTRELHHNNKSERSHLQPLVDDLLTCANASQSFVIVTKSKGFRHIYSIGDQITVSIQLYDGYGMPKRKGGDHLRIRMKEDKLAAYSAGHVIDHDNGTYTGIVRALWSGHPVIEVALFYTMEAIQVLYSIHKAIPSTRVISALFEDSQNKLKAQTECHPFRAARDDNEDFCNFTAINTGMSWFCKKPKNPIFKCGYWTSVKIRDPLPVIPLSRNERNLLSSESVGVYLPDVINVTVLPRVNNASHVQPAAVKCSKIHRASLWQQKSPTGFYLNNSWKIRNCKAPSDDDSLLRCLRGRNIFLLGDATMRAWFQDFEERFMCDPVEMSWSKQPWFLPLECSNAGYNFKVRWHTHALPVSLANAWQPKKYAMESVAWQIDHILSRKESHVFLVIHLYAQFLVYPVEVFTDRVRKIRDSVTRLLDRKPDSIVVLKGPNAFRKTTLGDPLRQCDYFGYVYADILSNEFNNLRDKVLFLDQMDMSVARDLSFINGNKQFAVDTLQQMLSYVCD